MPGRSCGMEKKVKKQRAADAGFSSVGVACFGEAEAATERVFANCQKQKVVKLVRGEQAECSTWSRGASGQLYQELCTVEERCNADDSVSAATWADSLASARQLDVGDAVELVSSSSRKGKRTRRVDGEPCKSHASGGQLNAEAGPSNFVEIKRKVRREFAEDDGGNGAGIEGSVKKGQKRKRPEEDRVWQYVCKRAVYVSPPVPARRPEDQNVWSPPRRNGDPSWTNTGLDLDCNLSTGKTSVVDLTFDGDVVKATVTRECREVQTWIERQSVRRFGLDLEWQPNRSKGGKENKVSLLQLSTGSECLLVQMLYLDSIPDALVQLLKDPDRIFAGVGILNDAKKLERDHGLVCKGEVELTTLAVAHFKEKELKNIGLKALAKKVLHFDICKSKRLTLSNWARLHLSRSQVEYASLDAWVSLAIYSELERISQKALA